MTALEAMMAQQDTYDEFVDAALREAHEEIRKAKANGWTYAFVDVLAAPEPEALAEVEDALQAEGYDTQEHHGRYLLNSLPGATPYSILRVDFEPEPACITYCGPLPETY